MRRKWGQTTSERIALGGILAAGSLTLLLVASVIPVGRTGIVAISGLFPMIGVLVAGRAVGLLCWFAAGVLGLVLLPDKQIALLYLLFFGLYPVWKGLIEGIRLLPLEWILKLLFFNMVFTLLYFLFHTIVLPNFLTWTRESVAILYGLGNIGFLCYDILLSRMVFFLRSQIK